MIRCRTISVLAALLLLSVSCNRQSPAGLEQHITLSPESGKFGISSMGGLGKKKANAAIMEGSTVEFNLGKIKGSTGFFFLLYNIGLTPITDVSLSIAHSAFTVFPTSMDTLIPGSDVGMLPVVKVSAFHGTPLDGVGTRPLLPKGINEITLLINGNSKTADGNDTVISLEVAMDLEALVMDLSLESMAGTFDLITSPQFMGQPFKSVPEMVNRRISRCVTTCINDTTALLTNEGNVPLHVTIYSTDNEINPEPENVHPYLDSTLEVNSSLPLAFNSSLPNMAFLVIASGENAVSNPENIVLHENGKYYVAISKGNTTCEDVVINQRFKEYLKAYENNDCRKIWALVDNRYAFYGENYNEGDSTLFRMYDLLEETLVTSYSGTLSHLEEDFCDGTNFCSNIQLLILATNDDDLGLKARDLQVSQGGAQDWVTTESMQIEQ